MKSHWTTAGVRMLIAAVLLVGWPLAAQDKPDDVRRVREADEKNIDRICAPLRKEYEAAKATFERADRQSRDRKWQRENNMTPEESREAARYFKEKRVEAARNYCDCLRKNYEKAGLVVSEELEKICGEEEKFALQPDPMPPITGGSFPLVYKGPNPFDLGPPAGAKESDCPDARKKYVEAVQRWADAGLPTSGFEGSTHSDEISRAAKAYCACLRQRYGGKLPPDVEKFCLGADSLVSPPTGSAGISGPPLVPPPPPVGNSPADPCGMEMRSYSFLSSQLDAMPSNPTPERMELQRGTRSAFEKLCECLRRKSPERWKALCEGGADSVLRGSIEAPATGGSSTPQPPGAPPPLPVPPLAPGGAVGGSGSGKAKPAAPQPPGSGTAPGAGAGGSGPGTGTGPPPPPPREGSFLITPGTSSNVSFSNVSHPPVAPPPAREPHNGECRNVVSPQVVTFPVVGETSFYMKFASLAGPLACPVPVDNGVVVCTGSFPGLFGQDGVSVVRASNVSFTNGRMQGRLEVASPVAPFSGNFSGALSPP